jgi:hypothetical protein
MSFDGDLIKRNKPRASIYLGKRFTIRGTPTEADAPLYVQKRTVGLHFFL